MPTKTIHNLETGEITEVEMTAEEIAEVEAISAEVRRRKEEAIAKEAKRLALLEKLGITEDEARLLLGGN